MTISAAEAQELLNAVRYLWRGTRWSAGKERYVSASIAGHVFLSPGLQRPFGEFHEGLTDAYARADLDPMERLVVGEYYGLIAFPSDLTGGSNPLVGRVSTSTSRQSDFASRAAIAAARQSGVEALAAVLEPRSLASAEPLAPVPDPLLDETLRRQLGMSDAVDADVLRQCVYAAHDLADRAPRSEEIHRALNQWKAKWVDEPPPSAKAVRFAVRHSAFAALHLALWSYAKQRNRDPGVETATSIVLWPALAIDRPRAGRVIETERWGVIDQVELTDEDLVCLCGLVFNDDDPTGAAADFVMPILANPEFAPRLNRKTYELLVWGVVRYLASRADWRAVELVAAVTGTMELPERMPELLAWAAHVASMFGHDALAWRLANQADRLIDLRTTWTPIRRIVMQVRSGILVRTADRLLETNPREGAKALRESIHYIQAARLARADRDNESARVIADLPVDLRLLEALLVAHRYQVGGQATGLENHWPLAAIKSDLVAAKRRIEDHVDPDDDDFEVLMRRVRLLEGALTTAELDDSALGPFLAHDL